MCCVRGYNLYERATITRTISTKTCKRNVCALFFRGGSSCDGFGQLCSTIPWQWARSAEEVGNRGLFCPLCHLCHLCHLCFLCLLCLLCLLCHLCVGCILCLLRQRIQVDTLQFALSILDVVADFIWGCCCFDLLLFWFVFASVAFACSCRNSLNPHFKNRCDIGVEYEVRPRWHRSVVFKKSKWNQHDLGMKSKWNWSGSEMKPKCKWSEIDVGSHRLPATKSTI